MSFTSSRSTLQNCRYAPTSTRLEYRILDQQIVTPSSRRGAEKPSTRAGSLTNPLPTSSQPRLKLVTPVFTDLGLSPSTLVLMDEQGWIGRLFSTHLKAKLQLEPK